MNLSRYNKSVSLYYFSSTEATGEPIAGIIFLNTLAHIWSIGGNPNSMTVDELKKYISSISNDLDMKKVFKEAKSKFENMRENGTLDQEGKKLILI